VKIQAWQVLEVSMGEDSKGVLTNEAPLLKHTVLGSAVSGLVSRIPCHPLDTVKARLQSADGFRYNGMVHCLKVTLAEEGIRGLYRGFGAVAVGGTPAACVYLTSYEALKTLLKADGPMGHLTAGMGAEAVACAVFVPVDVIKERLQVQHSESAGLTRRASAPPRYKGSWDAVKIVAQTEGLLGLYKGYAATLASFGPFSALYFLFYEQAKKIVASAEGVSSVHEISTVGTMMGTAASGAVASVLTNPLDLAKLRLQTQVKLKPGQAIPDGHLTSFWHAFRVVYQESGVKGLFRGAGARVAFHMPSTCITFTCFEECRKLMQRLF